MDSRPGGPDSDPGSQAQRADQLYAAGDLVAALDLYRLVATRLSGDTYSRASTEGETARPAGDSALTSEARGLAHARSRIGAILAQQGDLNAAEAQLQLALTADATLPAAHSNLGNVYYNRGQFEAALEQYETAVRLDPDNPLYLHNQHAALKKLGRLDRAVAIIKRAHGLERQLARQEARDRWRQVKQRTGCLLPVVLPLLMAAGAVFALA